MTNQPTPSDPSPTARTVSEAAKEAANIILNQIPIGSFADNSLPRVTIQQAINTETAALRAELKSVRRGEELAIAEVTHLHDVLVTCNRFRQELKASIQTLTAEKRSAIEHAESLIEDVKTLTADRDAWQVKAVRSGEWLSEIARVLNNQLINSSYAISAIAEVTGEALSTTTDLSHLVCIEREKYEALKELIKAQEKWAYCNEYNNDNEITELKTKSGLT